MSNDETQPVSTLPPALPPAQAATMPAYAPAPQPRKRGKLLLAGGAVGVALVAGAGGFALGHATAADDRDGPGRFGFMQDRGQQGTFPGQGQPPRGFPDRDGDGREVPDDDQGLPDSPAD